MRASSRKLLVAAVALGLLGFIVYRSRGSFGLGEFSGAKLLEALRGANLSYLALSLVAIYACYALRSLRWEVFQRNLGPSRFWQIYEMTLAGFSAVFLLGRAAEPVRPLLLARKEKLPIAGLFGIYVLERIFDTASTAVIAATGLWLFQSRGQKSETAATLQIAARTAGSLLFAGVIVAAAVLLYMRLHGTALLERRLQGWHTAHGWKARVARIVLGFARGVQTIRTWTDFALAVFYSVVHWLLVLSIYFLVLHSFGPPLNTLHLGDAMLVMAVTSLGSVVQLPAVGGGAQAFMAFALTKIFNVPAELAIVAAIVTWLITFAVCSFAGVPLLIHEGWSMSQLREMAKHEDEIIDSAEVAAEKNERAGESAE